MSMELRRLQQAVNKLQQDEWSRNYTASTVNKRLSRLEWAVVVGWVVGLGVFAAWIVS